VEENSHKITQTNSASLGLFRASLCVGSSTKVMLKLIHHILAMPTLVRTA